MIQPNASAETTAHDADHEHPDRIADPVASADRPDPLVETDLLVEDVSIDGMCGVY